MAVPVVLFCWGFFSNLQLCTSEMPSGSFSGFGHVQKHCTSTTVSSRPEIPLGENATVQNPEQNLVPRHCFEYFIFLIF